MPDKKRGLGEDIFWQNTGIEPAKEANQADQATAAKEAAAPSAPRPDRSARPARAAARSPRRKSAADPAPWETKANKPKRVKLTAWILEEQYTALGKLKEAERDRLKKAGAEGYKQVSVNDFVIAAIGEFLAKRVR